MAETIYLDLHGVLADFTGDALELCGIPRTYASRITEYNDWRLAGAATGVLWQRVIGRGWRFCAEQTWLPWGREVLEVCTRHAPTVILTAPYSSDSAKGVYEWRDANAPGVPLAIAAEKHLFAHRDALLIDDKEANIEAFRNAGGRAILFPAPWNSARDRTIGSVLSEIRGGDIEQAILEECAGLRTPRPWGAAVGAVLEGLRSQGLLDAHNKITAKGRERVAGR